MSTVNYHDAVLDMYEGIFVVLFQTAVSRFPSMQTLNQPRSQFLHFFEVEKGP